MSERETPTKEEIERAWDYHNAADTMLHSRTQILFVAQSFLITGFLIMSNADPPIKILMLLISVFGAFTSGLIWIKNSRLADGIRAMKNIFLDHDKVYKEYRIAIREDWKPLNRVFADVFPGSFVILWILLVVYTVAS
jgi:hypothetical protein